MFKSIIILKSNGRKYGAGREYDTIAESVDGVAKIAEKHSFLREEYNIELTDLREEDNYIKEKRSNEFPSLEESISTILEGIISNEKDGLTELLNKFNLIKQKYPFIEKGNK